MCGEHRIEQQRREHDRGSSPHVRGTRPRGASGRDEDGIIPACAGNTLIGCCPSSCMGDHPRMCGEHNIRPDGFSRPPGSSPHVRGTPRVVGSRDGFPGIIPTCAGNTSRRTLSTTARWDHPRMCGEHSSVGVSMYTLSGSSPHVRGTPRF